MADRRIDFISAYCDRWCERCAFTARCSQFAATAAIAMCGDVREGIELAVGVPQPEGGDRPHDAADWIDDLNDLDDAREEAMLADMEEAIRAERRQPVDVRRHPLMVLAEACSLVAFRWLRDHAGLKDSADASVAEAIEVASFDAVLVSGKLFRALQGRSDDDIGGRGRDSDGSAKVALLSIERSALAWRIIADATGQRTPAEVAEQLLVLRREGEAEFPRAWAFVRPGFDEVDL